MYPGWDDLPGLKPMDLTGDGEQLVMRIPDTAGGYKCAAEDPRVMVPREVSRVRTSAATIDSSLRVLSFSRGCHEILFSSGGSFSGRLLTDRWNWEQIGGRLRPG